VPALIFFGWHLERIARTLTEIRNLLDARERRERR
jgi:hypothetical protein